jgi:NitT/TauT family transport system substrate-binding protein
MSLKKSGISKPADLAGHKGGAPSVDAAFRLFNVFARVNGVDTTKISWVGVQPQVREPMLVRGDIDFSAGWSMAVVPGLLKLGIPRDDINVMMMNEYGLDLYANAVFTTPAFAKRHPEAVRGFVKATIQSWLGAAADPDAAVAALKKAEPLSDPATEMTRLKAALGFVITPRVRASGFGDVDAERLKKHIEIVTTGFHLPRKPLPQEVFDASYLPPLAERKPK